MKKQMWIAACALMLIASPLAAQTGAGSGSGSGSSASSGSSSQTTATTKDGKTATTTVKTDDAQFGPKFVRALTNVQIELNLSDQLGAQPAEKKTVSMIASSGNWGKIRSAAQVMAVGEPPYVVELNVDARPLVSMDGLIQLELTLNYAPVKGGDPKEGLRQRPSGINQSQTVILQSGKPLIVSQAADPVSDRKVVIEVKATILK